MSDSSRSLLMERLEPGSATASVAFDPALNALRGWCALVVVFFHAFGPLFPGRGMVYVFFVISGYVIALTNQRPLAERGAGDYWRRRAVRLVPLYLVAVVLSLGIALYLGGPLSVRAWLTPFVFAQNEDPYGSLSLPTLWTNLPLWSLNYEVVFYCAFLLIWRFRPHLGPLAMALLVVGLGLSFAPRGLQFVGDYFLGFLFFVAGVFLAWSSRLRSSGRDFPFLGLTLLFMATSMMRPFLSFFSWLRPGYSVSAFFGPADLEGFLPALVMVAGAVGRRPARYRILCLLAAVPAWGGAVAAYLHSDSSSGWDWMVGPGLAVAGTILVFFPIGGGLLRSMGWAGGLSYALYLVHYPILSLFGFRSAEGMGLGRKGIAIGVSIALAALLEHGLQPLLARGFHRFVNGRTKQSG